MKRPVLLVLLLALAAGAVWLAARGCGARRDPVERLVADMVQIPGRDYRMGKFEVTQAQWEAVMGENPSVFKGADHPVENVSWDDCQAFLEKLNAHPAARASGLVFRLPTEEEWETACRAGSTNAYCRLADGTEITEATLGRVAWFDENLSTRPRWLSRFLDFAERLVDHVREVDWSETLSHKPVGRKEPNAWGLHDMHGNVREWTETATLDRKYFFLRSGGWRCPAWGCAVNAPSGLLPSDRESDTGFRLCATPSPAASEFHAEPAENAEPRPGEAGSPAGGAGDRSEPEGVSRAESAEGAEFGSPAGGAGERSEPEGVLRAP
jgi:formylglycine-generating enzyme required for sulfatase activity